MTSAFAAQQRADAIKQRRIDGALDQHAPERSPHRMRLSIRKRSSLRPQELEKLAAGGQDVLVVRCDCMAQTNDQDLDPSASVDWHFWAFDYLALIPLTQPARPVFDQHVAEFDEKSRSAA